MKVVVARGNTVKHNGQYYHEGAEVDIAAKADADRLIAAGSVRAVERTARATKPLVEQPGEPPASETPQAEG